VTALKPECVVTHNKPEFTLSEERSKVEFKNPKRYEIKEVKVDGCVIVDNNEKKCDYLVNIEEVRLSIFVELKGSKVMTAIEQLENTHSHLFPHCYSKVKWFVSSTRCPLSSTQIQVQRDRIRNKYKAELEVKNSPLKFTIPSN